MIPAPPPRTGDTIFDAAIRRLLKHEGVYSDHPDDPGGATKYGISLRFAREHGIDLDHDGDVDVVDILAMSLEQAIAVYREKFWDRYGYARFGLTIGGRLFGMAVNMGPRQAHRVFQRALRATTGIPLADDGILGPKTLEAFSRADVDMLLAALRSEAAGFYRMLASSKPNLAVFLPGWLNRAYA